MLQKSCRVYFAIHFHLKICKRLYHKIFNLIINLNAFNLDNLKKRHTIQHKKMSGKPKHKKPPHRPSTMFLTMDAKKDDDEDEANIVSSEDDDVIQVESKTEKEPLMDEAARLKDIEERDELAERLKQRDDSNTKRKGDQQSQKILEEAAKRLKLEKEDRKKVIPKLRVESRRTYLERREVDKLEELEDELRDEEEFFQRNDVKLTKYEIERYEAKKKIFEIGKQYKE